MIRIEQTDEFADWYAKQSPMLQSKVDDRLARLQLGNLGDRKSLGGNLFELRLHQGPGYRIYFTRRANGEIVILLCAGPKKSQSRDIAKARKIAQTLDR